MLTSLILFYFIIIVSFYYVGTLRFFWMKSALQIKWIIIIIISIISPGIIIIHTILKKREKEAEAEMTSMLVYTDRDTSCHEMTT